MTLPVPLFGTSTAGGSTLRQIAATSANGVVNSAPSSLGNALLVQPIGGAAGSGGGVGGSLIGAQVLSAAANAAKVALGTVLVGEGSAVSGSVRNPSNQPGVLIITDPSGKVLARIAVNNDGQPALFNPKLYPLLANAGAAANADNDALGNYTLLGQTPLGMQWMNVAGSRGIGWTAFGATGASINPATFPFNLYQVYVAATDSLVGLGFNTYNNNNAYPSMTGDASQTIILFDPNGQPVAPSAYRTGTDGVVTYRVYVPGGVITPGWWVVTDNGHGNDELDEYVNRSGQIGYVLGGGGAFGTSVCGLLGAQPGGADVITYAGGSAYIGAFNYTSRRQYQAATSLYRQGIQSLTFTMLFPAAPNGATVVVSAVG